MKKYKIYIVAILALAIGLLIGWLLFKNGTQPVQEHSEHSSNQTESEIWTCSMHPQIRQNEPGDCPICGMDGAYFAGGLGYVDHQPHRGDG